MNKFLSVALLFLATITTVNAQEWQTDFARAKEIASKENRPIILVFQGSDWCAPCIKLDREVWGTEAFKTYAKKHYVMLQADFPRKSKNALSEEQTKANAKLAEKYNKIVDGDGLANKQFKRIFGMDMEHITKLTDKQLENNYELYKEKFTYYFYRFDL